MLHDEDGAGVELVGVFVLVGAALLVGGTRTVDAALLVGDAGTEDTAEEGVSVDTVVGVAEGPARPARRFPRSLLSALIFHD